MVYVCIIPFLAHTHSSAPAAHYCFTFFSGSRPWYILKKTLDIHHFHSHREASAVSFYTRATRQCSCSVWWALCVMRLKTRHRLMLHAQRTQHTGNCAGTWCLCARVRLCSCAGHARSRRPPFTEIYVYIYICVGNIIGDNLIAATAAAASAREQEPSTSSHQRVIITGWRPQRILSVF